MGRGELVTLENGTQALRIEPHQSPTLLAIYGAGYLAVTVTFAILYAYAYRDRAELELNQAETMQTWASLERHLLMGGVGLLSITIALLGGEGASSLAGLTYLLLAPVLSLHGIIRGRQYRAMMAQQAQPD